MARKYPICVMLNYCLTISDQPVYRSITPQQGRQRYPKLGIKLIRVRDEFRSSQAAFPQGVKPFTNH
jgi:hypothetical protein